CFFTACYRFYFFGRWLAYPKADMGTYAISAGIVIFKALHIPAAEAFHARPAHAEIKFPFAIFKPFFGIAIHPVIKSKGGVFISLPLKPELIHPSAISSKGIITICKPALFKNDIPFASIGSLSFPEHN